MILKDLNAIDRFAAFSDYISVADAKKLQIIPEDYKDVFLDYCECGSENIVDKSLVHVMCCNPRCKYKIAYSLASVFSNYNCKGIGASTCLNIVASLTEDIYSVATPFALKSEDFTRTIGLAKTSEISSAVYSILNTVVTPSILISRFSFPAIGSGLTSALEYYGTVHELFKVLDTTDKLYRLEPFGFKSPMKLFYLNYFKNDMLLLEEIFKNSLREPGDIELTICITGSVSPNGARMTRDEFVKYANNICVTNDGRRLYEIKNTAGAKSAEYVIADSPSGNRKYSDAIERAQIYGNSDFLMTSTQFVEKLKMEVDVYNGRE